jgi:hypothetical protein
MIQNTLSLFHVTLVDVNGTRTDVSIMSLIAGKFPMYSPLLRPLLSVSSHSLQTEICISGQYKLISLAVTGCSRDRRNESG